MVTIKLMGGLANQFFQISFIYAYAKKHNLQYCVPKVVDNPHYMGQKPYTFPGINYCDEVPDLPIYKEEGFTYSEIPYMDNVCFDGYFQSFLYSEDYRDELLKAFGFKYEMKKNYCSVHLRYGDYLDKPECHPPVTKGYVFEAMMNIMTRVKDWEAIKFLVFSDSIRISKEMLSSREFKSFPIEYSERKNEVEDLELASSCQYNIGSNSSYSLWIYYLNQYQNKIGVFPQIWFGKELPNPTIDLYPPNAVIL